MIHDITLPISEILVSWPGFPSVKMRQPSSMKRGDAATVTFLDFSMHTGTHLDAPAHFVPDGTGVDTLDLNVLVGPALVVEAMDVDEITADILASLSIPPGIERLLIHTKNSNRWINMDREFDEAYVAVTADGSNWLVDRGIKLIGIDYLSVAPFDDLIPTHQILLKAGVIPVEGLNLHGIAPGLYQLVCLPLKITGCDGSPVRAILID